MAQGLFQFNNSIINEILNFTTSSFDLLFVSGPKGSSKSETINRAATFLEEKDFLIFEHFCFENTVIDDFLLNFYDSLRNFAISQTISLKKFVTDSFKEKVSHYFKTIPKNCILIIENFEKVDENIEIIDFLSHLASYKNVKIIIISKNREKNLFRFKKIKINTLLFEQISKDDFQSKLTVLSEPLDKEIKEKFYEATSGLELFLQMSLKYVNVTNSSIEDLIKDFERRNENSIVSFEEFIVAKFYSLAPAIYKDFYKILCTVSHPLSINCIKEHNLGDIACIDYLKKHYLVGTFKNEVYVKDYFKQYVINTFSIKEKYSFCKKMIDIYEDELTKSPKDRLIRLSRESIRKEIEHLNTSIPSIGSKTSGKTISYMGSSSSISKLQDESKRQSKLAEKFNKIKEKRKALTQSDSSLLISTQSNEETKKPSQNEQKNKEKNRLSLINLLNSSREYTKNYKYYDAISELEKANEIDTSNEFKIEIYTLIAKNYECLNDFLIAQKYYNYALDFALETQDPRICEIKFLIASSNKSLYKIEMAQEQFKNIAENENYSHNFRAKAYLELGEIYQANSSIYKAIEYYESAIELISGKNKSLACQSYYKLARLYDENHDYDNAIKYYQKNYLTSSEPKENKYYSISLTNIALISIEQGKNKEASEFLKLALLFDKENNDLENVYFSQKELAKAYLRQDEPTAMNYYQDALDTAQLLNDPFKEALVFFEIGEFYYDRENDIKALKSFLNAKEKLKNTTQEENISRIESRINDIKIRLDNNAFNLIMEKYDNK